MRGRQRQAGQSPLERLLPHRALRLRRRQRARRPGRRGHGGVPSPHPHAQRTSPDELSLMSKKPTKGRKVRPPKTVSPAPTLTNQEASADQLVAQGGDPSVPSLAYSSALPDWSLVRDVMTGARAVRGAREKYLPRITDETNEDYNRRVEFAPFVNNFRDSIETIVSKPFSKDVALQGDVSS